MGMSPPREALLSEGELCATPVRIYTVSRGEGSHARQPGRSSGGYRCCTDYRRGRPSGGRQRGRRPQGRRRRSWRTLLEVEVAKGPTTERDGGGASERVNCADERWVARARGSYTLVERRFFSFSKPDRRRKKWGAAPIANATGLVPTRVVEDFEQFVRVSRTRTSIRYIS